MKPVRFENVLFEKFSQLVEFFGFGLDVKARAQKFVGDYRVEFLVEGADLDWVGG